MSANNIKFTYPEFVINQENSVFLEKNAHNFEHILILLDKNNPNFTPLPYQELITSYAAKKENKDFAINAPNSTASLLIVKFIDKNQSKFTQLTELRKFIAPYFSSLPDYLAIIAQDYSELAISILANLYGVEANFKKDQKKLADKITINLHTEIQKDFDFKRIIAEARGTSLVRYLATQPHNFLTPEIYYNFLHSFAKEHGFKFEFYSRKNLQNLGAGAFLAVAGGEGNDYAGIAHLKYIGAKKSNEKISLVGKGICFDTGGHNLKTPAKYMSTMKHDMTGSAVAIATMMALKEVEAEVNVDCWLGIAQNDIGFDTYRPGDVVTAANGTTIEVINTDAEGRMILADTLHLASKENPNLIIDYATLTGACAYALDSLYSGVITNKEEWFTKLINIGEHSAERVWPFSYSTDYDDALKSDIADIKQCTEVGYADHIRAARFLGKFIEDKNTPWVHIDLSSHENKGGLGAVNSEITGFGVAFSLAAILDYNLHTEYDTNTD